MVTPTLPFGQSFQIFGACGLTASSRSTTRGQRLIVDNDKLGSIARLRLGFGDNEGDMIADAANAVGEQNRTRGWKPLRPAPGDPA